MVPDDSDDDLVDETTQTFDTESPEQAAARKANEEEATQRVMDTVSAAAVASGVTPIPNQASDEDTEELDEDDDMSLAEMLQPKPEQSDDPASEIDDEPPEFSSSFLTLLARLLLAAFKAEISKIYEENMLKPEEAIETPSEEENVDEAAEKVNVDDEEALAELTALRESSQPPPPPSKFAEMAQDFADDNDFSPPQDLQEQLQTFHYDDSMSVVASGLSATPQQAAVALSVSTDPDPLFQEMEAQDANTMVPGALFSMNELKPVPSEAIDLEPEEQAQTQSMDAEVEVEQQRRPGMGMGYN